MAFWEVFLMSKTKFILRWGVILFVSIVYYVALAAAFQQFDIYRQNEALSAGAMTLDEYRISVDSIALATDGVVNVSIFAFPVCLLLSLLAFKKIR